MGETAPLSGKRTLVNEAGNCPCRPVFHGVSPCWRLKNPMQEVPDRGGLCRVTARAELKGSHAWESALSKQKQNGS
jgi:hypothetical protein